MGWAMNINKTVEGARTTLALDGWLDTQSAPDLAVAIEGLDEGVEELVLDFSELEYISSAGIRQVVAAYKKMGSNLIVCNVKPEVLEVFKLTGIDTRLNIA
jgi:anti-anti-sigma factor